MAELKKEGNIMKEFVQKFKRVVRGSEYEESVLIEELKGKLTGPLKESWWKLSDFQEVLISSMRGRQVWIGIGRRAGEK